MPQILPALVSALALLEVSSAAPKPIEKRSFKVDRVAVGYKQRNAIKAMHKTLNKYGWPIPDTLHQAFLTTGNLKVAAGAQGGAGGQVGVAANAPQGNDVEFLTEIEVGGQKMVMDFDTGSSDLWLFSTALPPEQSQGHTLFDPQKSQTFQQQQGSAFNISFGDGSAAAGNIVGTDTVNIGGATATGQTVELATAVSGSFVQDTASNGLVGLAFSTINTVQPQKAKTFFDTIQDQLAQPVMLANLKHNAPGSYEFGKVDNTLFQGQLKAAQVDDSQGFWQIQSNVFGVAGNLTDRTGVASPAIADTGTTLMLVDTDVAVGYYSAIPGAKLDQLSGMFVFPCDAPLQDFQVELGAGNIATIDKSLLNFQPLQQAVGGARKRQLAAQQGQTCIGSIQSNQGQGLQIYGDILFKSQIAVFDIQQKTVSFAPHAN